jgi:hypothetical protein
MARVDRYSTFADALEGEVLTEMAGTFFGARKALEDMVEDFQLHVEDLRNRVAKVYSRVFFLRWLLLGPEGEAALFDALGLPPPFSDAAGRSGSRTWRPEDIPFALLPSSRYAKLVHLAYAEVHSACEVYMNGALEDDPMRAGRKRISLNYRLVKLQCARLNERIAKLNQDMPPSSVLQYARNIASADQPGQGSITNTLGADSLDKGLMFQAVDFAALNLWVAPDLPAPEACRKKLVAFCHKLYDANAPRIRRLLADLKS